MSKLVDIEIVKIEIDKNHIHLLISYCPDVSISKLVHKLKQKVAYTLWGENEAYMRQFYFPPKRFTFSREYFACSIGVGVSCDTIKEYISKQG